MFGQHLKDLTWRQKGVHRLVAFHQNPLVITVVDVLGHVAFAVLLEIGAIPSTFEMAPPALQGG